MGITKVHGSGNFLESAVLSENRICLVVTGTGLQSQPEVSQTAWDQL
jgi:hypothetical protein